MKASAALILSLLIASIHSLTLPSIHNYLLTHKSPADLAALDYAQQNITDEPIVEIVDITERVTVIDDEAHMDGTAILEDNHPGTPDLKQITIESSEPSHFSSSRDVDEATEASHESDEILEIINTNNKEIVNEDGTETADTTVAESVDTEVRIKIPVNSFEETPQLPKLSLLKPEAQAILSKFSKPKPLNLAAGSGIKTVYVRATKTVKQQPMCITVYGLKPPCSPADSPYDQGYHGFKSLEEGLVSRQLKSSEGNSANTDGAQPDEIPFDGADRGSEGAHQSNGSIQAKQEENPSEMRALTPLLNFLPESQEDIEITTDKYSDDINEDEHSSAAFKGHSERQGKLFMLMNSYAKSDDDRIFPNKAQAHHIVTETIYSTKVLPQEGVTATLLVENCVPINSHIPFCGNIYPIYQVPELPTNYFHVPVPVLHGKFPVEYKPNFIQLAPTPLNLLNEFSHKPLSGFNPNVHPLKVPHQNLPPTSSLGGHVPGFINKISNLRLSLTSAAQDGFGKVGHLASQVSNLASSVHSHIHDLHQHKMNFLGGIHHMMRHPQEDVSGTASEIVETKSNDIKPVREDLDDIPAPAFKIQDTQRPAASPSESKSLESIDNATVQPELNKKTSANVTNTNDKDCLNDAIVKKLNEITLSGNITNHLEASVQVVEEITKS